MNLTIVAMYRSAVEGYDRTPGVSRRQLRDGSVLTIVDCELDVVDGQSYARPRCRLPEDLPSPAFRARVTVLRDEIRTKGICAVAQPTQTTDHSDFEQRLLRPGYHDYRKIVFEFQRGDVFFLAPNGAVEVRLVAVDRFSGAVGTATVALFHTKYAGILERCRSHLAGTYDLFPQGPRPGQDAAGVPQGVADLDFSATALSRESHTARDQMIATIAAPPPSPLRSEDEYAPDPDASL